MALAVGLGVVAEGDGVDAGAGEAEDSEVVGTGEDGDVVTPAVAAVAGLMSR